MSAPIGDVDGDGKADTEFFSESNGFKYGIRTASGATLTIKDSLAGPGVHSGWTSTFESGPPLTVLDDGRSANLYSFVGCKFVRVTDKKGAAFSFTLNGFGKYGTGVECIGGNSRGGRALYGVLNSKQSNGQYKITTTLIGVSNDGKTATVGARHTATATYSGSSTQVKTANRSTCESTPIVHTSGH